MRPMGTVSSPMSDGSHEIDTAWLQPASEPARLERETTYGGPKDEAKMVWNLGIAYNPRGSRRRSGKSSQSAGDEAKCRRRPDSGNDG